MKNSNDSNDSGIGLLTLGVLSMFLGPFTAVPGLLFSRRFRPFSNTAFIGYFLCWLFLSLYMLGILLVAISFPYVFATSEVIEG